MCGKWKNVINSHRGLRRASPVLAAPPATERSIPSEGGGHAKTEPYRFSVSRLNGKRISRASARLSTRCDANRVVARRIFYSRRDDTVREQPRCRNTVSRHGVTDPRYNIPPVQIRSFWKGTTTKTGKTTSANKCPSREGTLSKILRFTRRDKSISPKSGLTIFRGA